MKSFAFAAATILLVAGPSFAQTAGISIDDAIKMVRERGMTTVTQIEMDDGEWEVEGRNAAGQEMEIDLNATSGAITKQEVR